MVYKAINGFALEYISDIFTKVSDSRKIMRNLRSVDNDLLRGPSSKTGYSKILTQYHQLCNGMNSHWQYVRSSSSLNSFKNALKTYLLNN